jgi:hypothetical protein
MPAAALLVFVRTKDRRSLVVSAMAGGCFLG